MPHRLSDLEHRVVSSAHIPDGGDPHPQRTPCRGSHKVTPHTRGQRFPTFNDLNIGLFGEMGVHIDQTRHQKAAFQIHHPCASRSIFVGDVAIPDNNCCVVLGWGTRSIE
jgi:hypothetical protein